MPIKRYYASKDNTITNAMRSALSDATRATGSNMGAADVLETFSIYGQASSSSGLSQELSRILIQFPVDTISTDRTAGTIPASGSVSFYLKMYNARHAFTLPRNFILDVVPVSQSWEEGVGLDMDEYIDKTYGNSGSNWINRGKNSTWARIGGDYVTSSAFSSVNYTVSFALGYEDVDLDITTLMEEWITGSSGGGLDNYGVGVHLTSSQEAYFNLDNDTAATAVDAIDTTGVKAANVDSAFSFTIPTSAGGEGGATTIRLSAGESVAPPVAGGGSSIGIGFSDKTDAQIAALIINAINAVATTNIVFAVSNNGIAGYDSGITAAEGSSNTQITLTMDAAGTDGNLTTAIASTLGTDIVDVADFTGGTEKQNTATVINNPDGATVSYYTKKFFSRSSEFFFKRPVVEARWAPPVKDDRGNFYFSSSLAPAADNLNTLYLYNYVRGQLVNIPAIGTGTILLSLYSGSTAPLGSKLLLPSGGDVVSSLDTNVTGGWVSTGIYSASFGTTGSLGKLFDVWHTGSTEFFTSSLSPKTLAGYNNAPTFEFVTNITNLKPKYSRSEKARMRLFVRPKNWNPNIYNVATSTTPNSTVVSASYKIVRLTDNLDAIPYGTGSDLSTYLSYDVSGNYFDVDMGMLEADYSYGVKFVFYNDSISTWVEQPYIFRFRVEEDT